MLRKIDTEKIQRKKVTVKNFTRIWIIIIFIFAHLIAIFSKRVLKIGFVENISYQFNLKKEILLGLVTVNTSFIRNIRRDFSKLAHFCQNSEIPASEFSFRNDNIIHLFFRGFTSVDDHFLCTGIWKCNVIFWSCILFFQLLDQLILTDI